MKQIKDREKLPALRIGEEAINNARAKFQDGTPEREFFENLLVARLPYTLISSLTGIPHGDVRDMATGKKQYTEEAKQKLCGQINKLIDRGLDIGVYPCSDMAVIGPVTTVLLQAMANESRFNKAKHLLEQHGLLKAQ